MCARAMGAKARGKQRMCDMVNVVIDDGPAMALTSLHYEHLYMRASRRAWPCGRCMAKKSLSPQLYLDVS